MSTIIIIISIIIHSLRHKTAHKNIKEKVIQFPSTIFRP